jgi:phospholipase C
MDVPRFFVVAALLGVCSCNAGSSGGGVPSMAHSASTPHHERRHPIQHVVVIIQENRTVDNLFQFFRGANTVNTCTGPSGVVHSLVAKTLQDPTAPSHTHAAFVHDLYSKWDGISGDPLGPATNTGWVSSHCAYVPQSQAQPYYSIAQAYAFANNFFQTNQGPSYPAHQYLVSGSSACTGGSTLGRKGATYALCAPPTPWPVSDNPGTNQGGCDSTPGTTVMLVSPTNTTTYAPSGVYPCFTSRSIIDEAQAAGLTWRFYQAAPGAGYWKGLDSIQSVWCSPKPHPCAAAGSTYKANVRYPSPPGSDVAAKFIADLGSCGTLAKVTYITPDEAESDHAGFTDGSGPSYVTRLVNAIGRSCFWNTSAVFITWDDWGGWFDHLCPGGTATNPCPTPRTTYELGYRVPLIVASPYARNNYVTSNEYDFGSILLYIENNFGLGSLGTADSIANDLTNDVFNYEQSPTRFKPFTAPLHRAWFLKHQTHDPPGTLVPDDDKDSG